VLAEAVEIGRNHVGPPDAVAWLGRSSEGEDVVDPRRGAQEEASAGRGLRESGMQVLCDLGLDLLRPLLVDRSGRGPPPP